jgi:hypothetical protein
MKNFYEMIEAMGGYESHSDDSNAPNGGLKHYMFFSNLKVIRDCAEKMLAMDEGEVDAMLGDGHDWAADHIATSKDDIEEVCNWLSGSVREGDKVN